MQQPTQNSQLVCRTCKGNCTIKIKAHTRGGTTEKTVTCPACKGSGKAGYLTK